MRFPSKPDCLKRLKHIGLAPAAVIDVGVHGGTLELMRAFPGTHHLLVEPEPAHAAAIAKAYQDIPHTLAAAAASDREGSAPLTAEHRGGERAVTHSRFLEAGRNAKAGTVRPVRLARLDTLVSEAGLNGPFLLKIDTDGHEMEVIAGAPQTLRHCAVVIIEAPLHTLTERAAALEAAGLKLIEIIDLAYYFDTLSQVDLVFANPCVFDPPALDPWRHETFRQSAWRQLQPWTAAFDGLRRRTWAVRRRAAQTLRRLR